VCVNDGSDGRLEPTAAWKRPTRFCCRLMTAVANSCIKESHAFLPSSYVAQLPSPLSLHIQAVPAAQTEERLRQR
jgi:hypothetical protein